VAATRLRPSSRCARRWPASRKRNSRRWCRPAYVEELKANKLPESMQNIVMQLLFKPDKNGIEYKALDAPAPSCTPIRSA
jgi:hypothetical protein